MQKPILYSFRRCPYAIRARMALAYSDIVVEHREVQLKNKPAHMLSVSPKGTVPVLILADRVIDESLEIMLWALGQQDKQGWLSNNDHGQQAMYDLIEKNDGAFKFHLDRYKYPNRYENVDPETHRQQANEFIQILENRLEKNRYLFSDSISIADVAIFPFVRQFSKVDPAKFDASPYINTKKWLKNFLTASLFRDVMTKYPVYIE